MPSVPEATSRELLAWLLRRRRCFRVSGDSMLPVLAAGQRVLVDPRIFKRRQPRVGEIVVARHPFRRDVFVVKRVQALVGERVRLLGDNPQASTDSRSLGDFALARLVGPVTSALAHE